MHLLYAIYREILKNSIDLKMSHKHELLSRKNIEIKKYVQSEKIKPP